MDQEKQMPTENIEASQTSTQWTPEYAGRTLFLAFRFPQGNIPLQNDLFHYIHGIRSWTIPDDEFKADVVKHTQLLTRNFLFPETEDAGKPMPQRHSTEDIDTESMNEEITKILNNMINVFKEQKKAKETLMPSIVHGMLNKDIEYLDKGRPRGESKSSDPKKDQWSSFVIDYAMRGTKTGLAEFDEMFRDIKGYIEKQQDEQTDEWKTNIEPRLTTVTNAYNQHHPDNQFSFGDN